MRGNAKGKRIYPGKIKENGQEASVMALFSSIGSILIGLIKQKLCPAGFLFVSCQPVISQLRKGEKRIMCRRN